MTEGRLYGLIGILAVIAFSVLIYQTVKHGEHMHDLPSPVVYLKCTTTATEPLSLTCRRSPQ